MIESRIKRSIINYLNSIQNLCCFPIAVTGIFDQRRGIYRKSICVIGTPDILVCYKGRFIAIEVKSDTGRLSQEQKQVIDDINLNGGGLAFTARSVEDVMDKFEELGIHSRRSI